MSQLKATDKELIEGCRRGENSMQRLLFDLYAAKMMSICRRYCRDRMEAEDMLQEGFIKVFTHISQIKGESIEAWMRQIFVHVCLSQYKKNKRLFLENEELGVLSEAVDENGLQQLETNELMDLIDQLPQGAKLIFNLFAVEGFNHNEISTSLGITESASRAQLTRARHLLKSKLHNHI